MSQAREYELAELHEDSPADRALQRFYFPGAVTSGGHDGVIVEVSPKSGPKWRGVFAFGRISPRGVTGVFNGPGPLLFCVVATGAGYIVRANRPEDWQSVNSEPIVIVRSVPERELLIFGDFTRLVAYSPAGLLWATEDLSWNGLEITSVTSEAIEGYGWDAAAEAKVPFIVHLESGKTDGGARPPKPKAT